MYDTSLDMLTRAGIISFDANEYLSGRPSEGTLPVAPVSTAQIHQQPAKDEYKPSLPLQDKPGFLKKLMAAALALYISGVIASKGKLNPLSGVISELNIAKKIFSFFAKIFK